MIKPTQEIEPEADIEVAVKVVDIVINNKIKGMYFSPLVSAWTFPKDTITKCFLVINTIIMHIVLTIKAINTIFIVMFWSEPSNQKVIVGNVVFSLAIYFVIPIIELVKLLTIIPAKTKFKVDEYFVNILEINIVNITTTIPKLNDIKLMIDIGKPINIPIIAPIEAPFVTPNTLGETKLFLNISWNIKPAILKLVPTIIAINVLGSLNLKNNISFN